MHGPSRKRSVSQGLTFMLTAFQKLFRMRLFNGLFNAESEEELDMITAKNEGITEAINVLKSMSLRRPFKALFEDYMKAKRDRWDEDEYIRDEGIAIGSSTAILTILEQKGTVPADLRERILSQKDGLY